MFYHVSKGERMASHLGQDILLFKHIVGTLFGVTRFTGLHTFYEMWEIVWRFSPPHFLLFTKHQHRNCLLIHMQRFTVILHEETASDVCLPCHSLWSGIKGVLHLQLDLLQRSFWLLVLKGMWTRPGALKSFLGRSGHHPMSELHTFLKIELPKKITSWKIKI